MIRIVIVYHSVMGHTEAIARSIQAGAASVEGVEAVMVSVEQLGEPDDDQGGWTLLTDADALVFGSPTFMGTVSAPFKAFMDLTGQIWFRRGWMDKLAAGFTVGGGLAGDKQSTLQAMHTFASQHGMLWVSLGVGVNEEGIDRLSSSLGMMAQAENAPVAVTPPRDDHRTAEAFGRRIALAAARWGRGKAE
ncbi:MAG: flavodoxin family protein [Phycisphaerales bacterium]